MKRLIVGVVALTTVALVAAMAAPADAVTRRFTDARGDVRSTVDVYAVQVANGTPPLKAVRVSITQRELRAGDFFDVWYDTDAKNPGPEFRASWVADSDSLGLFSVDTFTSPGEPVVCPNFRVRSSGGGSDNTSRVFTPRLCLGEPGAVAVSVRAQRHLPVHTPTDWAPAFRTFTPAVHRG